MNVVYLASVVIDNYNYDRYLREAIDSALAQDYPNTEIIVVDDGSTDDSRTIIESYGDQIVPVLKANGGQASAFNAGFAASSGDIVCFLDSDDLLDPTAVRSAVSLFDDDAVVKVHWPLKIIDEFGNETGDVFPDIELPEGDLADTILQNGPQSVLSPPTSGNAWSRQFLAQVLPIPEDVAYYKVCADEYLYNLAPALGRLKTIAEPKGAYRMHGRNNYVERTFEEKVKMEMTGHLETSMVLERFLNARNHRVDRAAWDRNSWFHRLHLAIQEIIGLIPPEANFLLVDDNTWGMDAADHRKALPFLERDGEYWGAPPNDRTAIRELERMRRSGAGFLVFGWPAFWWFEEYTSFLTHLRGQYRCVLNNERLVVFDIR